MGKSPRTTYAGDRTAAAEVRRRRLAAGLSLRQLADALGMSTSGLSKIETGGRALTIGEAAEIAAALHLELSDLVCISHAICPTCRGAGTIRTTEDYATDVAPPDRDFTDAEMDEAADREVARYEATIYGEDGAA